MNQQSVSTRELYDKHEPEMEYHVFHRTCVRLVGEFDGKPVRVDPEEV